MAGPLKVDEITSIQVIVRALGEGDSHNKERYIKVLDLRFMRCLVDTKVVILYIHGVDNNPGKQLSQVLTGVFTR